MINHDVWQWHINWCNGVLVINSIQVNLLNIEKKYNVMWQPSNGLITKMDKVQIPLISQNAKNVYVTFWKTVQYAICDFNTLLNFGKCPFSYHVLFLFTRYFLHWFPLCSSLPPFWMDLWSANQPYTFFYLLFWFFMLSNLLLINHTPLFHSFSYYTSRVPARCGRRLPWN